MVNFKEKERSMYASIRRYKTDSAAEVTRLVNEEFVPQINNLPGFLAYYVIDTGEAMLASISVFESKDGAEESNRMAASWVKGRLPGLLGPPEITVGEAVAHTTVGELVAR
ncbi:MAG: hypothetical protein WB586_14770 [Chthoniobacterales bacterium]